MMSNDRVGVAPTESTHTGVSDANSNALILKTGHPTSALNLDERGLLYDPNLVSDMYMYILRYILLYLNFRVTIPKAYKANAL